MCLKELGPYLPAVFLLAALGLFIIWQLRKQNAMKKVRRMTMAEKTLLINRLAEPFGFAYCEEQELFTSRLDAWQRAFGYEALFDQLAPSAQMVIDAVPIYFNYEGKTWLIEFWKGQYGICGGAEIGIYHADGIVAPHQYRKVNFRAANDDELLPMSLILSDRDQTVLELAGTHWWLTAFRPGSFYTPGQLQMRVGIQFGNRELAHAFMDGLRRFAPSDAAYFCLGNTVSLKLQSAFEPSASRRLRKRWAQLWNRLGVKLFRMLTAPFRHSADRILYLYFQFPFILRMLFSGGKRYRKRKASSC